MYSTKADTLETREYLNLQGQFDKNVWNLDNHRPSMTTEAYDTALGELRTKFNTAMKELETKQEKLRPDREKAMGSVMASLTGFATKTFQLVAREREAIFPKSETKKQESIKPDVQAKKTEIPATKDSIWQKYEKLIDAKTTEIGEKYSTFEQKVTLFRETYPKRTGELDALLKYLKAPKGESPELTKGEFERSVSDIIERQTRAEIRTLKGLEEEEIRKLGPSSSKPQAT